ncbi:unnamed protein product, partial [Vitis vinifera]
MASKKAEDTIKRKRGIRLLWMGRWDAILEGERSAPGPALSMISSTPSSKAAFNTTSSTDALTNCIAYWRWLSSSSSVDVTICLFSMGLQCQRTSGWDCQFF